MAITGLSAVQISAIGNHPNLPISGGVESGVDGFMQQIAGVPPAWTGLHSWCSPSPFMNVPNDAVTILTNVGRTAINRLPVQPTFVLDNFSFAVGIGGYNPADPTQATVPNPAAIALASQVFPALPNPNYEPVDRIERPNAQSIDFLCRCETPEALFALGEAGLFAEITNSPVPAEIGTWIMFAIMHFPMQAKSLKTVQGYRFALQF